MNHLGVFAKYWQPGTVKTRLAKCIGPVNAAGLYRGFVDLTLRRFSTSAETRSIWSWPPERKREFDQFASTHWQIQCQAPGDLGEKIYDYFKSTLSIRRPVVLIGSDTPNLPLHLVDRALELLETVDVVIGPSMDGGYYLIGMRTDALNLFRDIPWSTSNVLASTIDRIEAGSYSYHLLEPWRDIDTYEDLIWLHHQLPDRENKIEGAEALQEGIVAAITAKESNCTTEGLPNRDQAI